MERKLKNMFKLSEWSGAVGDIGTTLPIAFVLIVFNGFPPERIFFLWGIIYIVTGGYFKVPVSVQPLKAMAVIAIANGCTPEILSSTAVFYGILLIILSTSGILKWLQKWFSDALIKGIQLGIGLILAKKAVHLLINNGLLLYFSDTSSFISIVLVILVMIILWYFQFRKTIPAIIPILIISTIIVIIFGVKPDFYGFSGTPILLQFPNKSMFLDVLLLLIIPQLPLTLGNAVFAASDSCKSLWGSQSRRVSPRGLGISMGLSNVVIGFLGGFPICHGAGGIGAHAQFGGKTGGTTIILGILFVLLAIIPNTSVLLFLIPIPVLAALLLFDSARMMMFIKKLSNTSEMIIAIIVGSVALISNNLTIAFMIGLSFGKIADLIAKRNCRLSGRRIL
jgi:SulP family sulfate permease